MASWRGILRATPYAPANPPFPGDIVSSTQRLPRLVAGEQCSSSCSSFSPSQPGCRIICADSGYRSLAMSLLGLGELPESPPGPFFCPWNRISPRLIGPGFPAGENAPVSRILTLETMLRRALEEARAIANDDGLDNSQKRVDLRKILKAATSAIWTSHHSGGKRRHDHGNRQ